MSDLSRDELNGALEAVRDQIQAVEDRISRKFSEMREDQAERFSRVEAFQEMASAEALRKAHEGGKLEQRVESLEVARRESDREQRQRDAAHRNHMARLYVGLTIAVASGILALALKAVGG